MSNTITNGKVSVGRSTRKDTRNWWDKMVQSKGWMMFWTLWAAGFMAWTAHRLTVATMTGDPNGMVGWNTFMLFFWAALLVLYVWLDLNSQFNRGWLAGWRERSDLHDSLIREFQSGLNKKESSGF